MPELDVVIGVKTLNNEVGTDSDFSQPGNGGGSPVTSDPLRNVAGNSGASLIVKSIAANRIVQALENSAKKIIDYNRTSYGDFTGDYLMQKKIDQTYEIAGQLGGIASNIGTSFMAGGPLLAAGTTAVEFINLGTSAYINNQKYNRTMANNNAAAGFNSARIGVILTNGNRG